MAVQLTAALGRVSLTCWVVLVSIGPVLFPDLLGCSFVLLDSLAGRLFGPILDTCIVFFWARFLDLLLDCWVLLGLFGPEVFLGPVLFLWASPGFSLGLCWLFYLGFSGPFQGLLAGPFTFNFWATLELLWAFYLGYFCSVFWASLDFFGPLTWTVFFSWEFWA